MSHIFAFGEAFWLVVHPSRTLRGHLEPSFSLLCTCRVEAAHSPLTPLGEICMLLFGWWLLTPNSPLRATHSPTALMLYGDWASHWPRRTFSSSFQPTSKMLQTITVYCSKYRFWISVPMIFRVPWGEDSVCHWGTIRPEAWAWRQHWERGEASQRESGSAMASRRWRRRENVDLQ